MILYRVTNEYWADPMDPKCTLQFAEAKINLTELQYDHLINIIETCCLGNF